MFLDDAGFGQPVQNSEFLFADAILTDHLRAASETRGYNICRVHGADIRRNKNTVKSKFSGQKLSRRFGLLSSARGKSHVHVANASAVFQFAFGSRGVLTHVPL